MIKGIIAVYLALAGFAAYAETAEVVNTQTDNTQISDQAVGPENLQPVVAKTYLRFWNNYEHQRFNNCYNYATNRVTNNFAQPGAASGNRYTSLTCANVSAAAAADLGLEPAAFSPYNGKDDETLIALVVAPNFDYHWYRRDSNGRWSHKPGGTAATVKDNAGMLITDPENANRGPYSDFCGYYRVKNFPKVAHEQNGGYVRVGSMRELPDLAEDYSVEDPAPEAMPLLPAPDDSFVEIQMYSGRENPRFSMVDYFSRPSGTEVLSKIIPKVQESIADLTQQNLRVEEESAVLGSKTVIIHDGQGLMFPRGTSLELRAKDVVVQLPHQGAYSVELPEGASGTEF